MDARETGLDDHGGLICRAGSGDELFIIGDH